MKRLFFRANAHEGCVWVDAQQRLYFTTTTDIPNRRVDLCYFDFSGFNLREPSAWYELASEQANIPKHIFVADLNMANAFCLSADGSALLVAEQGDENRPSVISRIDLWTAKRTVIVSDYHGRPFNSLNKVKVSRNGHLIFTDPDYGFRQGFRPPPKLAPGLYVRIPTGEIHRSPADLDMPHGIVLNENESRLYITDTSADGGHGQMLQRGRKSVYCLAFDPETALMSESTDLLFEVDRGVPDGCIFVKGKLLTAAGDGVYEFDPEQRALRKIILPLAVYNLCAVGPDMRHLFATADEGVYLILDWEEGN